MPAIISIIADKKIIVVTNDDFLITYYHTVESAIHDYESTYAKANALGELQRANAALFSINYNPMVHDVEEKFLKTINKHLIDKGVLTDTSTPLNCTAPYGNLKGLHCNGVDAERWHRSGKAPRLDLETYIKFSKEEEVYTDTDVKKRLKAPYAGIKRIKNSLDK